MKKLLKTDRGEFNVRLYGDADSKPLMLVHGWPQSSYCWHHLAAHLGRYYVICPDLRGMGDSNRVLEMKAYEKDEMAKDLFAVVDNLGIDEFYLGGHDWGGAVVQEMAILKPERIKKLMILNMIIINNAAGKKAAWKVLVNQLFRSSWYQFFMSVKDFPEAMIAGKEDVWVRFFSRGISKAIPEDAIEEYIRCYKIPNTITTTSNIYRNINRDRKRWKVFEGNKIEIPTHIIHGVLDPVIIKEYYISVEDCFSEVNITYLEGGHFICDEQPEEVANAMKAFLD